MNTRFMISVIVLTIASLGLGFVVHGTLLGDTYAGLPALYRSMEDSQNYFGFMVTAHILIAIGLTWVYRMGHKADQPWLGQGFRFGLAVAVLSVIPTYMIYHAVQNSPQDLMIMQIAYDVPAVIVMGIIAAFINK